MAQLLIRNLDEKVVNALKERARRAGRSLQAEAKALLEQAGGKMTMDEARRELEAIRKNIGNRKFSDSAKLIREDRDR